MATQQQRSQEAREEAAAAKVPHPGKSLAVDSGVTTLPTPSLGGGLDAAKRRPRAIYGATPRRIEWPQPANKGGMAQVKQSRDVVAAVTLRSHCGSTAVTLRSHCGYKAQVRQSRDDVEAVTPRSHRGHIAVTLRR